MEARAVTPQHSGAGRNRLLSLLGDEALAARVGAGSDEAFSVLYGRYHQELYRYCRSLLGNDQDAQDALQSALLKALAALRESRRDAPLRPWLYRIAHNESIGLLRRRRPSVELPEQLGDSSPSAQAVAEQQARLATLLSDLRELPERQRAALLLRELSGLPHVEIAQTLGTSVAVAKQTVLEARRSLSECAQGRAMECEEIEQIVSAGDRRTIRSRRVRAHLRDCATCAAFAASIGARTSELRAVVPVLPAATGALLLRNVLDAGRAAHSAAAGAGMAASGASGVGATGSGITAGAAGKGLAAVASAKLWATGAAVVATAAAGYGAAHALSSAARVHPGNATLPKAAPGTAGRSQAQRVRQPQAARSAAHGNPAKGRLSPHSQASARHPAASAQPGLARAHGRGGASVADHGAGQVNGRATSRPSQNPVAASAGKTQSHAASTTHGHAKLTHGVAPTVRSVPAKSTKTTAGSRHATKATGAASQGKSAGKALGGAGANTGRNAAANTSNASNAGTNASNAGTSTGGAGRHGG